ncbi:hypothetical protein TI05_18290 [Achromatium sp. WMS3]|nr:hypothetical protein TI05_18290 [Achromatium sp. WMS3]
MQTEIQPNYTNAMHHVYCHLKIPLDYHLESSRIEDAVNTFFQQHPEVLEEILNIYFSPTKQGDIVLPHIPLKKRKQILASLIEEDDNNNDIPRTVGM